MLRVHIEWLHKENRKTVPLTFNKACTISMKRDHKIESLRLDHITLAFCLLKKKDFGYGQLWGKAARPGFPGVASELENLRVNVGDRRAEDWMHGSKKIPGGSCLDIHGRRSLSDYNP